jgi:hypothetical protein
LFRSKIISIRAVGSESTAEAAIVTVAVSESGEGITVFDMDKETVV